MTRTSDLDKLKHVPPSSSTFTDKGGTCFSLSSVDAALLEEAIA
jgi:hypothetical protein